MYNPEGTDSPNEFVELFNLSATDTLSLKGWKLRDMYSTDDLVDSGYGFRIPPFRYALVFEGDYDFSTGIYASRIPEDVILIKVDDSSIGNGLSARDSLYLIDSTGIIRDSLGWSDIAPEGFSIEKVRPDYPNTPSNWLPSRDSLGTPGYINSVHPFLIDGAILADRLTVEPPVLNPGGSAGLSVAITNTGLLPISGSVDILHSGILYSRTAIATLDVLDTLTITTEVGPFTSGYQRLEVILSIPGDLDTSNNRISASLGVRYSAHTLVLNEFLPIPGEKQTEFVELVHEGKETVNLLNWRIADSRSGTLYRLPAKPVYPEEFILIAPDSTLFETVPPGTPFITPENGFPTLNNSGDEIRIFDPFGTLIDSLSYSTGWPLQSGKSLEKIFPYYASADSSSWRSSVNADGMTPGRKNSVTPLELNGAIVNNLIRLNPLYPGPTDSVSISVSVANHGVMEFTAAVKVFSQGDLIHSAPVSAIALAETTEVSFTIPPFGSGIHPLLFQLYLPGDQDMSDNEFADTLKVRFLPGVVRINEFMPMPNNDQVEFIELVALEPVILEGWGISDRSNTVRTFPRTQLQTGDYLVIAADSSLFSEIPAASPSVVPANGFPTLNNSGDAIYLYDMTRAIIDSLVYNGNWPVTAERSTEKLRPEFPSPAMKNWKICTAASGMTPGTVNSIALLTLDGTIVTDSIKHRPFYPKPDQIIRLSIPITNIGVASFSGTVTIEEQEEELAEVTFPTVTANDTIAINVDLPSLGSGSHILTILLDIIGDLDPSNNLAQDTINVSYPFGSVVINEFFPRPDSTQTEFIELVNPTGLNLSGWAVSDNSRRLKVFPSSESFANEYLVIGADSAYFPDLPAGSAVLIPPAGFPNLNNTGDALYLYDMTGNVVDSLRYTENWPIIDGRSTEKFRPDFISDDSSRWAVAVNPEGMTPGRQNSVYYEKLPKKGMVLFTPNPFSPDHDGFEDVLSIQYRLPFDQAILKVEIFDMLGRTIARPYWNVFVPHEGVLTWDGNRDQGETARMGIYIVKVTAKHPVSGKTWESVQTVVLAKKL